MYTWINHLLPTDGWTSPSPPLQTPTCTATSCGSPKWIARLEVFCRVCDGMDREGGENIVNWKLTGSAYLLCLTLQCKVGCQYSISLCVSECWCVGNPVNKWRSANIRDRQHYGDEFVCVMVSYLCFLSLVILYFRYVALFCYVFCF